MSRKDSDLGTFTLASDYNPAHYNWPKEELAALENCKATAQVIKARLEGNGLKIKEMYVIEHTDTKGAKKHFHILVKFEPSYGATKEKIAEYIGVLPNVIEKLNSGRYSFDNMLAYLVHAKDKSKRQYAPEDVVTLAGTDYMDYFKDRSESWKKARPIVAKKGEKTLKRLFQEAKSKLESGELLLEELAGTPEYRKLFLSAKYKREVNAVDKRVKDLAYIDKERLRNKYQSGEISMEEAKASEEYKLVFKYYANLIF